MIIRRIQVKNLIILAGVFANIPSVLAQGTLHSDPETGTPNIVGQQKEAVDFLKDVRKQLITPRSLTKSFVEIRGIVKPHEYPTNVSISQSSGNAQFDANCLQAVLGTRRSDTNPLTLHGQWFFSENTESGFKYDFKPDSAVTVFKIPISVTQKYPNLFTVEELLSEKNQLKLADDGSNPSKLSLSQVQQMTARFDQWNSFFKHNPHATRASILSKASSLDSLKPKGKALIDLSLR